jgi:hypothetical protein
MTLEFDVEARLRGHMKRDREEILPPRTLAPNILRALDTSTPGRPGQNLRRQLAVSLGILGVALLLVLGLPRLRYISGPAPAGTLKPIVTPCHVPDWVPEPIKSATSAATGCTALSPVRQLDLLVVQRTGVGPSATDGFTLPDGRYTVFVEGDPDFCYRSFTLEDDHGRGIRQDWSYLPPNVAGPGVPLVQRELPRGVYHLVMTGAKPNCPWMVQVVLNSMLYKGVPPTPWRSPLGTPAPITLTNQTNPRFGIEQTGFYDPSWTISPNPCTYAVDLRASDGHTIHLGDGTASGDSRRGGPIFFGAGSWQIEMVSACQWRFVLKPWMGDMGGGTRGF